MLGLRFFTCRRCGTVYSAVEPPTNCRRCDDHVFDEIRSESQAADYFSGR